MIQIRLNPPKDRSSLIERMTTTIRRRYGVRASSCFLYGQIWAPFYVHALKNSGLSSLVISGYRANLGSNVADKSFTMNELGKRIKVYVMSDPCSQLVSQYAQGLIDFDALSKGIDDVIANSSDDIVLFLNIDQILQGSARDGRGDDIGSFITSLIGKYRDSLVPLSQINTNRPGYLDSGWYGRDAWARGLSSFNELFVRNASYRYLLNRYTALSDFAASYKKDKPIKREIEAELSHIPMGPLFVFDSQCTPLRRAERRSFWKGILESEWKIVDTDPSSLYYECDYEEIGIPDYIARNQSLIASFSPLGGGVMEFAYRNYPMNLFDTRAAFDKAFPEQPIRKSFTDIIRTADTEYDLSQEIFQADVISKLRGECQFVYENDGLFSILKRYKLRTQTLVMEAVISADRDIDGEYEIPVYLESSDLALLSQDQRRLMMLGQLEDIRTVRYTDTSNGLQLSFSSTESFSLREERLTQRQDTSQGTETFELFLGLRFSFPLHLERGSSKIVKLIARVSGTNGDKE